MTKKDLTLVNENRMLLDDKGLLILRELLWYCQEHQVVRVKYADLKRRCDETLNLITEGKHPDMGGSFLSKLKQLESKDDPKKRYLSRKLLSSKDSYIIPNLEKIKNLLISKSLIYEDEEELFPSTEKKGLESLPGYHGVYRISYPSKRIKVYRDWKKSSKKLKIYLNNPWEILANHPEDEKIYLQKEQISELLKVGEAVALQHDSMPFEIILEHKGIPSFIGTKDKSDTFIK